MALVKVKPTSPGRRGVVKVVTPDLYKGKPHAPLLESQSKNAGRNNNGRITTRHQGGGHKQSYRLVDFKRRKFEVEATVERLEYDPNRTAFIALVKYSDGELNYIIAPQRLKAGDQVVSGDKVDVKPGNAMPLRSIPVGTIIHNVELKPGKGGQMARSAGTFLQLVGRDQGNALLRMPSGEVRMVKAECMATIGAVSNPDQQNTSIGKAGRARHLGYRPTTRGIVMNPVDHPHGGRTNGGRAWVTPWGKPTKGKKTRHNKKTDGMIVRRRHAAKK